MRRLHLTLIGLLLLGLGCGSEPSLAQDSARSPHTRRASAPAQGAVAVFAGGCFWCMESNFEAVPGVSEVRSGYTGGRVAGPSYEEVSSHRTQHREAIWVEYDPSTVTYARLLEVFWHNVDPTQDDGQFCDRGHQYTTAIFVQNAEERRLAEASKQRAAERLQREVLTPIVDLGPFWLAEGYHQNYYRTHPDNYHRYRTGCGRDARLRELWGGDAGH